MSAELLILALALMMAGGLALVVVLVNSAVKDHYRKKKPMEAAPAKVEPVNTEPPPGWAIVHNGSGYACSLMGHVWYAREPLPTYEAAVKKSWEHYRWCEQRESDQAQWKPLNTQK